MSAQQQQQQLLAAQQLSLGASNPALTNSYLLNSAAAPAQDQYFSGLQAPASKSSTKIIITALFEKFRLTGLIGLRYCTLNNNNNSSSAPVIPVEMQEA